MDKKSLSKVKEKIEQDHRDAVKDLTAKTLEKISNKECVRNVLQEEIRILKHDLTDLKEGRLDRIVERQSVCVEAMNASVFTLVKDDTSKMTNQWYVSYIATIGQEKFILNNSAAKTHTSGSYKLSDGTIKYI